MFGLQVAACAQQFIISIDRFGLGGGELQFGLQADAVGVEQVRQDRKLVQVSVADDAVILFGLLLRQPQQLHALQCLPVPDIGAPHADAQLLQDLLFAVFGKCGLIARLLYFVAVAVERREVERQ